MLRKQLFYFIFILFSIPLEVYAQDLYAVNDIDIESLAYNDNEAKQVSIPSLYILNRRIKEVNYSTYQFTDLGILAPTEQKQSTFFQSFNIGFMEAPTVEYTPDDLAGVFRWGIAYEIELSKLCFSPLLNLDTERSEDDILVLGFSLNFDF